MKWYEPEDPTPREQCPCCDYFSLPERNEYLICPICFWEDDGSDVNNLNQSSGPNHMTLNQGRQNFLNFGSSDKKMLKYVLPIKERAKFKLIKRNL